jgi:translation initiation factor IF-2
MKPPWRIDVHWDSDIVYVGRALVREMPAPADSNALAHCWVTWGVITRSALCRVIREGRVIYPPQGQTASLDALKQFLSGADREEVNEGFQCSLHVGGFQELRRGDVVEAYRTRPLVSQEPAR